MTVHKFKRSLAAGRSGELLLASLWTELVPIEGGRKGDFMLGNKKVEVKSDSYGLQGSVNFFMERWSDEDKLKPGGPFQALEHGCQFFVYFYPTDKVAFVFDTGSLCRVLLKMLPELKPVNIRNVRWNTVGYKIPREALKDIYVIKDFNE